MDATSNIRWCRDCGRSSALHDLWDRHDWPYCATCFQSRFGTHPGYTNYPRSGGAS
jgi:hypothetical protein